MTTINKLYKVGVLAFSALLMLSACEPEEILFEGPYHARFTNSALSINEDDVASKTISIHLAAPKQSQDVTVTVVAKGTANFGVDYTLSAEEKYDLVVSETGFTVKIPAGEFSAIVSLASVDNEDYIATPRTDTLRVTQVSGGFSAGLGEQGKSFYATIIEDDCPVPSIAGTYNVVTTQTSPAGCNGVTNVVTITDLGNGVYQLSDVTGGLYKNCYDDADNPGQIETDRFDIVLDAQPDVVYGNDEFNGTGIINCNGSFTLSWSNGYGDSGVSVFTK